MNIVDQFHHVETVGDLKKALTEYDDSAKLDVMFSPNGLLALSLKGSKWIEMYLRVRKVETVVGKSKSVQIIAGENFADVESKVVVEPASEVMDALLLKEKLLYWSGQKDDKAMQGFVLAGLTLEFSREEYAWIYKKLALDEFINPENGQFLN
jgi:hypothetical protein